MSFFDKTKKSSRTARKLHSKRTGEINLVYWLKKLTGQKSSKRRKKNATSDKKTSVKGMPKGRAKQALWLMNPKNFWKYWKAEGSWLKALKITAIVGAGGILLLALLITYYAIDAGDVRTLQDKSFAETTRFYDRTGEILLFEAYGDQKRTSVDFKDISPNLRNATVAIEDKGFYEHGGFSLSGIARAFFNNLIKGEVSQGGSTITQQYIKLALLSNERSYERKVKEIILSVQVERLYSKDEILGLYLNQISYGGFLLGAETASQEYFDKPAKELTIDEAAFLAGIPQQPGIYNPCDPNLFDKKSLETRQDLIIDRMREQKYITKDQAEEAKEVDTVAKVDCNFSRYADAIAPHFVAEAQRELATNGIGEEAIKNTGLKVITTLDVEIQEVAEETADEHIGRVDRLGGNNIAIVAADQRTGQILAMVGSRDFEHPEYGAFNAATAPRQPGSSIKPYTYATMFETGKWGPGSILYDLKTDFGGGYIPKNFNAGEFNGAVTIRRALGRSLNIPAVKGVYIAGMHNVIAQAKKQGITTLNDPERYGLSLGLGAAELKLADNVTGYGTFAAGGMHYEQTYILKVTTASDKTIYEYEDEGKRVLSEQSAYLITDALSDRSVRLPAVNRTKYTAAIKTGTTSDVKDLLTMGYTDHITAGLWVGNHDNREMPFGFSSLDVVPIWIDFLDTVHDKKGWKDRPFKRPEGLKTITLDSITGRLPTEATTKRHTDIFPAAYKPLGGDADKYVIDTVSGKLATECTPESAKKTVLVNGIDAEIPPADPAYPRWVAPIRTYADSLGLQVGGSKPTATDDVHQCGDQKPIIKNFPSPAKIGGRTYSVEVTVAKGAHNVKQVEFKLDGATKSVINTAPGGGTYTVQIDTGSSGNHTFSVVATDVALYTSEASHTVPVTYAPDGNFRTNGVDKTGSPLSPNITFKWIKDSNATSYIITWKRSDGASAGSQTINNGSAEQSDPVPASSFGSNHGTYTWNITSYEDGIKLQTKEGTFTYP